MSPTPDKNELKQMKQEDAYYDAENKQDRQKNKKEVKDKEVNKRKKQERRP